MGSNHQTFEFKARFSELREGLDILHESIERVREATGRASDDLPLMLFETALGEIGGNVLTHGRPPGTALPVEYVLSLRDGTLVASLTDSGASVHEHLSREMPGHDREEGRGLAMARALLDELGYERSGGINRWRLVKRL